MTDWLSFEFIKLVLQEWVWSVELSIEQRFDEVKSRYKVNMEYSLEKFYNRLLETEKARDKAEKDQLLNDVDY